MFLNPIIAMLHNKVADRWHPIVFVENPLPGPPEAGKPVRHKSKMHHTTGFATQAEAEANAREDLAPRIEGAKLALETVLDWDGQDIPAMVRFFT